MRTSRLRQISHSLLVFGGLTAMSGCATMGGTMANSSGMGYYEQGNYVAAANEFQVAAMSDPSNPDYIANLAKSRMKMGDAAGSEQLYRQALTISPSHQPSYHGLAELMLSQGRGQEATAMMSAWSATQPYVAESHVELAWLQRELGQTDAAAQSLQKALQVNPSHSTALAHMGQYYEEIGRPDQAVAMYQHSLRSDWNQPEVHSRIAAASQSAGASSQMAATAMARGVHPYDIPRQQTVFGPPSPGAQMARMQMAQTQMAMNQNPMYGSGAPGFAANPWEMQAGMPSGTMSAQHSSSEWQHAAASAPTETAWTSFGTGVPVMEQPANEMSAAVESTMSTEAPFDLRSTPAPAAGISPTPDPAFSSAPESTQATQISWTQSTTPADSTSEPPLVDAF